MKSRLLTKVVYSQKSFIREKLFIFEKLFIDQKDVFS